MRINLDGILLIDNPSGYTSSVIVNLICKVFNTNKVGHTGTLDPLATGVLVICIGRATKLVDIFTNDDKEYIAEIILGIETDTLDTDGKILKTVKANNITNNQIINVLDQFIGEQEQEVPIYSSIKIKGKKLYEYARNNEEVTLPKRKIKISDIKLIDLISNQDQIKFRIKCSVSKGTYIRSLARDIGYQLGYPACISSLQRIRQGQFTIDKCYKLEDIENGNYHILSIREALSGYPTIEVDHIMEKKILNGMKLPKFFDEKQMLIVNKQGEALAIYQQDKDDNSKVRPLKIIKLLAF